MTGDGDGEDEERREGQRVLISVLAGQQDASTAVMAEVRRFVTLAR